jgi:subtilisin family serine protease
VAKNVRLHSVRVLGCDGNGAFSQTIAGVDWIRMNAVKPAVTNISLSSSSSSSVDTAVRNLIASGITVVVAAGNNNLDASNYSPARVTEAITVGATTSTDYRAGFSNFGSVLD